MTRFRRQNSRFFSAVEAPRSQAQPRANPCPFLLEQSFQEPNHPALLLGTSLRRIVRTGPISSDGPPAPSFPNILERPGDRCHPPPILTLCGLGIRCLPVPLRGLTSGNAHGFWRLEAAFGENSALRSGSSRKSCQMWHSTCSNRQSNLTGIRCREVGNSPRFRILRVLGRPGLLGRRFAKHRNGR